MTATLLAFVPGLYLWMFLGIFLHEAAHVFAARMVGFSPFALIVGTGPLLFQGRIRGIDVRFHLLPFSGMAKAMFVFTGLRWRGAIFSIAGLLSDVALLILMLRLAGFKAGAPDVSQSSPLNTFFALLALYQFMLVLASLIPMHVTVRGTLLPNDGRQFVDFVRGATSKALKDYEAGIARYDPQFRIDQSWLLRGDLDRVALLSYAEQDMAAGRYTNAAKKYLQIIERGEMHPAERAQMLDRIACIPVFYGDKSLLSAAEGWARQAAALLPLCKTVRGTLGSLLVEKGECTAGRELLMPLTSAENAPIDRILACSYLAKAFHCLGDRLEAARWLAAAHACGDGFGAVVARVESELAVAA